MSQSSSEHVSSLSQEILDELSAFAKWLESQKRTRNTIRVYVSRLKGLLIYSEMMKTEGVGSPIDFLERYLEHLRERNLNQNSVDGFLIAFDSYCVYKSGFVCRQTGRKAALDQNAVSLPILLEQLNRRGPTKLRAIVNLMVYEGLKIGECAALDLENIFFENSKVSLWIGSTGRPKMIVLGNHSENSIVSWLEERSSIAAPNEPALFVNRQGKRISTSGIDFLIRNEGHKLYLQLSPKDLRSSGQFFSSSNQNVLPRPF